MANLTTPYTELLNASLFKAATHTYEASIGVLFWPIIFMFTLAMLYIKTESPAFVALYAIIGNV